MHDVREPGVSESNFVSACAELATELPQPLSSPSYSYMLQKRSGKPFFFRSCVLPFFFQILGEEEKHCAKAEKKQMAADGSSELPGCTAALTSSRLELTDEITGDCQHAEVAAVEDVAEKKIDEEDGLRKMNDELELRTQAQQELSLNTTAEQSDLEQGADSGEHAGCGARREEEEGEQGACVDEKAGRGTDGQAGSSQQARPDCILRAYLPQTPQAPVAVRSANMNGSLPDYKDLLEKKVLAHGERVLCTNRRGMRFFGDLLDDGTIRYSTGVTHSIHLLDPVFSFAGGVDLHACQAAFLQAVKLTPLLHRHSVIRILPSPELSGQTPELDVIFTSPTKFNNFIGKDDKLVLTRRQGAVVLTRPLIDDRPANGPLLHQGQWLYLCVSQATCFQTLDAA